MSFVIVCHCNKLKVVYCEFPIFVFLSVECFELQLTFMKNFDKRSSSLLLNWNYCFSRASCSGGCLGIGGLLLSLGFFSVHCFKLSKSTWFNVVYLVGLAHICIITQARWWPIVFISGKQRWSCRSCDCNKWRLVLHCEILLGMKQFFYGYNKKMSMEW